MGICRCISSNFSGMTREKQESFKQFCLIERLCAASFSRTSRPPGVCCACSLHSSIAFLLKKVCSIWFDIIDPEQYDTNCMTLKTSFSYKSLVHCFYRLNNFAQTSTI